MKKRTQTQGQNDEMITLLSRAHEKIESLEDDNSVLRMHVELLEKDHRKLTTVYSRLQSEKGQILKQNQMLKSELRQLRDELKNILQHAKQTGKQQHNQSAQCSEQDKITSQPMKRQDPNNYTNEEDSSAPQKTRKHCTPPRRVLVEENRNESKSPTFKILAEKENNKYTYQNIPRSKSTQICPSMSLLGIDEETMNKVVSDFTTDKKPSRPQSPMIRKNCSSLSQLQRPKSGNNEDTSAAQTRKFNYTNWRKPSSNLMVLKGYVNKSLAINR